MNNAKKNNLAKSLCHSQFQGQDELYHHGILGMHWGVRRFQPYGQGYDPQHKGKFVGDKKATKRLSKKVDRAVRYGYGRNNPHLNELQSNQDIRNVIRSSKKLHDATATLREYERTHRDLVSQYETASDPSDKKYSRYNKLLSDEQKAIHEVGKQLLVEHYGDPVNYLNNDSRTRNRTAFMNNIVARISNEQHNEERNNELAKLTSQTYKALVNNKQKIATDAPKFYVEKNYEWLSTLPEYEGLSKSQIAKHIKVDSISDNGVVNLTGDTGYLKYAFPYVEYTMGKSGKLEAYTTATDD